MSLLKPSTPRAADAQLLVRITVAGTLAWWICTLLGQPRPLFAALVPLVAMLGDPYAAFNVSLSRVLGVFLGVLLGIALIDLHLHSSTATVALLFVSSLALGFVVRIGGAPNNQIAISALFMLYLGVASKAQTVGFARVWETAVGAGISLAVSALLWPPDPLAETRRRVREVTDWARGDLTATAELLGRGGGHEAEELLDGARERSREAVRYVLELPRGEQALRWNPLRRADRPLYGAEAQRLALAARAYRHVRSLIRDVADALAEESGPRTASLAAAVHTLADATAAALEPDAPRLEPLLERARAELGDAPAHSPHEHGIHAKLSQLMADLGAASRSYGNLALAR